MEPFELGERQGYADYLAGKVTYGAVDEFTSIPPEWVGDDEYIEAYTEGVDQARVDRENGRA